MSSRSCITHVAIRFRGEVYSLPAPNRHHRVLRLIYDELKDKITGVYGENQGFLDESGQYLTRREALVSALANNQVKDPSKIRAGRLFSEDVW